MENGTPYTLALWRVKEGREEEFVELWKGDLAAYFMGLPNPPGEPGTLIRSVEDPQLFYSFGPWKSLEELPLVVRLGGDSKPELASGESGVKGALGTILADVAVAASKGTWARLKICAAEDCRSAYYDHSKSRTGRWCAMETCGNRHKTRRYRKRRRKGVAPDA